MTERVLNLPLDGEEVIQAILDKIAIRLRKDCFLSRNLAYGSFECKVKIALRAHDVGRTAVVEVKETIVQGDENEYQHLEAAEAEFEIDSTSPTQTRVETGQDVPVETRNGEGKPIINKVKYSRKEAKAESAR